MNELTVFVPPEILPHLTSQEKDYLKIIFQRFSGYPTLEQMWQLMDESWDSLGCDVFKMDERVTDYYRHPVWLLNGLFIEQHTESLTHRRAFADWITLQNPVRIADFGGGFGSLARSVGKALPNSQIEVVEPYPRAVSVAMVTNTPNVRFVPALTGEYDLLIATDVFEHVSDPLFLCAETASHLKLGGQYLIANCFAPVIKCHLPQLFYFEYGWDTAMQAMGLAVGQRIQYGRLYQRTGLLNLPAARRVAKRAQALYPLIRYLPRGRARLGALAMKLIGSAD